MKINRKTQILNPVVYAVLYAIVFGITFWLWITDNESPTNWLLYVLVIWSVLAGLVKFILHSRKQRSQSA
jgi:hypothetical protein